jgi:endonuclease G
MYGSRIQRFGWSKQTPNKKRGPAGPSGRKRYRHFSICCTELEAEVRNLDAKSRILETYVICGPIFYFDQPVEIIGADDPNEVTIPIPHAYFKSVLTENNKGASHMWSFLLPNEDSNQSLDTFLVPTTLVEKLAGIKLWERLVGKKIDREKSRVRKMW